MRDADGHTTGYAERRRGSTVAQQELKTVIEPEIARYVLAHSAAPDAVEAELISATQASDDIPSFMQVPSHEGQLLTMLCAMMGARCAIELGTFTGYSTLCIAKGLRVDGVVHTCDVDDSWLSIARPHWEKAGVDDRIRFVHASAADFIRSLPREPFIDFAFFDADKLHFAEHYDAVMPRLNRGGVIVVDNVLWGGRVLDEGTTDEWAAAIHAFNAKVAADRNVQTVMLPIADGVTVIRKRWGGAGPTPARRHQDQ